MFRLRTKATNESRVIEMPSGHQLEVDGNYTFLRIHDPEQLGFEGIKNLLDQAVQRLFTAGLVEIGICNVCGGVKETELVYDNGSVGQICQSCLEEKSVKQKEREITSRSREWPLRPVAVGAGVYITLTWMLAWLSYDWFFTTVLGEAEEVIVPQLLIGLVMAFVGFALVLPVMFVLSQTRLVRMAEGRYYTAWLIVFGVFLGEVLYLIISNKTLNPLFLIQSIFSQHPFYIGTKIAMFVVSIMFLTFFQYKYRSPSLGVDS